jgi:hypothetical protein
VPCDDAGRIGRRKFRVLFQGGAYRFPSSAEGGTRRASFWGVVATPCRESTHRRCAVRDDRQAPRIPWRTSAWPCALTTHKHPPSSDRHASPSPLAINAPQARDNGRPGFSGGGTHARTHTHASAHTESPSFHLHARTNERTHLRKHTTKRIPVSIAFATAVSPMMGARVCLVLCYIVGRLLSGDRRRRVIPGRPWRRSLLSRERGRLE